MIIVIIPMVRVTVRHLGKYAIDVAGKTTLGKNVDKMQTQAGLVDCKGKHTCI